MRRAVEHGGDQEFLSRAAPHTAEEISPLRKDGKALVFDMAITAKVRTVSHRLDADSPNVVPSWKVATQILKGEISSLLRAPRNQSESKSRSTATDLQRRAGQRLRLRKLTRNGARLPADESAPAPIDLVRIGDR